MISVLCACGRKFKADDQHAGKRTRCPVCGNMLVIGQAGAKVPSNVSDNGEVPSWWFPSGAPAKAKAPTSPPPTRSGSDPDDVGTMVIPPRPGSQAEIPSQGSVGASAPAAGNLKIVLGAIGGALACAVVALVTIFWLQSSGKDAGPAPPSRGAKEGGDRPPADPDVPPRAAGPAAPDPAKGKEATRPTRASNLSPRLQVLIPAYFYPAGSGLKDWQHLIEAASRVKIVAIANTSSGPGDQRNPDYFRIIQNATENGVRVVGYVSTKYGGRPLAEVQRDMDRWVEYYPQLDGFFVDEQSSGTQEVGFYLKVRDHARAKIKDALLINNPGTMCDEAYLAQSVSDVTCIFSGFEGLELLRPPLPLRQYSPSRFAALAYQITDSEAMKRVIKEAVIKRIGYLYISDAPKGNNPWAGLPGYWAEEVEAISQID